MAKDRWHELCDSVAEDDNLATWQDADYWTERKLYFWHRYIDITTRAMVGRATWPAELAYVDLFAGAGVCTLKESGRRIPGSVLIAANSAKPFARIVACEKSPVHAEACRKRLQRTAVADRCHVLVGDCNDKVQEVADLIPQNALTLVFIDPTGLDARFETIAALAEQSRADLVVLFADAYDINRNAERVYRDDPNSKLDQVLGPSADWRKKLDALRNPTGFNKRRLFADIYKSQLRRHLGYTQFGDKTVDDRGRPLYKLIYASKHKLGLKFWLEATKKEASGQRRWF